MNVFTDGRYDAWATGGRYSKDIDATVYCHNRACADYGQPQSVLYEEEYGAGWYTPEECPTCFEEWHEDAPVEEEVDEDAVT